MDRYEMWAGMTQEEGQQLAAGLQAGEKEPGGKRSDPETYAHNWSQVDLIEGHRRDLPWEVYVDGLRVGRGRSGDCIALQDELQDDRNKARAAYQIAAPGDERRIVTQAHIFCWGSESPHAVIRRGIRGTVYRRVSWASMRRLAAACAKLTDAVVVPHMDGWGWVRGGGKRWAIHRPEAPI